MCLKFYSRSDVEIYSEKLQEHYNNYKLMPFTQCIDDLFACGLSLKFQPEYRKSYWAFGSDFTYHSDFFKLGDLNSLLIIFRGLIICEFNVLPPRINSVSPVSFIHSILLQRLPVALYTEIIHWTQSYPANYPYRKNFNNFFRVPASSFRESNCISCEFNSKMRLENVNITHEEYFSIIEDREKKLFFEKNKCPKCKKNQLKVVNTRWGKAQVCENYPSCHFLKKIDENIPKAK